MKQISVFIFVEISLIIKKLFLKNEMKRNEAINDHKNITIIRYVKSGVLQIYYKLQRS